MTPPAGGSDPTKTRFPCVRRQNIQHNSRRRLAECGPRLGLMLGGELAVKQASMVDGLLLDPFALFDDGWGPAEVGVGGHVVQALVVALLIAVLDEASAALTSERPGVELWRTLASWLAAQSVANSLDRLVFARAAQ